MKNEERRTERAGAGRAARGLVAVLAVAVAATGCEVTNPGPVQDQFLNDAAAQAGVAIGSILLGRPPEGALGTAVDLGATAYFAHHSRDAENEADAIAVRLLPQVGIDPAGLVTFFKELLEEQERRPSTVEQWFSTHPLTEERIANVRRLIGELPPDESVTLQVTSPGFDDFRARVARLPAPPPEFRQP